MNRLVKTKSFSLWDIDGLSVQSGLTVLNETVKSLVNEVPTASYDDVKFEVRGDGYCELWFFKQISDYEVKETNRQERKKKLAELLAIEEKETILLQEKFDYILSMCTNPDRCESVSLIPHATEEYRFGIYTVILKPHEQVIVGKNGLWTMSRNCWTKEIFLENITLENLLENY